MGNRRQFALMASVLALAAACRSRDVSKPAPAAPPSDRLQALARLKLVSVPDVDPPEQWPRSARDYRSTRFSPLADITADNVAGLKPAWTFDTGLVRGHEAAPVVVDGVLYVVTPFPNRVVALDLASVPPPVKWTFTPEVEPHAQGVACCDVVNRGVAVAGGKVFFNTLDDHTIALDAATGRLLWDQKLGDVNRGETMTMAPLVVRNRVLVGNSGGEMGVRGWLTALDTETGATAWRAYSTGPDADVRIGPEFRPFYASDRGRDLGVTTWPKEKWKQGGGTVWGFLSYDPELDLLFYGTANPGPWNAEQRPGDNKWTAGVFARRPDDGAAIWFYQWSPHDLHDYDGVNESILVDADEGGTTRKLLLHPDRNGYFYVLDRVTGQVLSAEPFAHITTSRGVDLTTGVLHYVPEKEPRVGQLVHDVCPAAPGAKDWQPSAFSPKTGLVYIPHNNLCQDVEGMEANYIAGTPYVGAAVRMNPGPGGNRGGFMAWDPLKAKAVWQLQEKFPVWSGALVTAGDVAFYGTMDGEFKAVDARSGKLLWRHRLVSGSVGQPVSYRGPDGKQYVAIFSGVGGWAGAVVTRNLDGSDPSAENGFVNAMKDLKDHTQAGGKLYGFALP